MYEAHGPQPDVLAPLVQSWLGKIRLAHESKQSFNDVGKQCMEFFSGSLGFMWQPEFMQKFVGGPLITPRFKVTIAKAFELVALYGPNLYWQNPARMVKPRKAIGIDPQLFGALGDPQAVQLFQMAQQAQMQRAAINSVVASLLDAWLNYTPTEQPGGGLATHASQGITEALTKGRACLWPKPFSMPGSNRVITGCFYDSVDNLLIDPDATSIHDARWIAQMVVAPVWQVERDFQLPPGSLQGYGSHESASRQGEGSNWDSMTQIDRRVGKTFDLITYYKVYSKGGVGGRLCGNATVGPSLTSAFDQVVGDYAYVCVSPNVPFVLNAPTDRVRSSFDSDIERMMRWPIPYWLDDKWPVTLLDFYTKPNNPWPIAPMAPGLGELTFINVTISMLMNRVWNTTRLIATAKKGLPPDIETLLKGGNDFAYLKLDNIDDVAKDLNFIELPPIDPNIWKMVDEAMMLFDKRTGLSELLYSMNPGGVASRSAEDAATKKQYASIRPEYMSNQVANWMTEAADMEKFCARWFVGPQDLQGYFGPVEQYLWQRYIHGESPEMVVREFRATVAANSTRKPDKYRDVENVNQMLQYFGPIAQGYFQATGDPGAINGIIKAWGTAVDQDVQEILLAPPPPPSPDPAAQQAAELQAQQMQQQLQMQGEQHGQKLQQGAEQHQQKLSQQAQAAQLKMMLAAMAANQKAQQQQAQAKVAA